MAQADTVQAKAVPTTRHAFADGSFKQMLIDGKWLDADSGKHFESRNPATGELLATVAEGDAEDINRAVAAARKAFEGPWSRMTPSQRGRIIWRIGDLILEHVDELAQLESLDNGKPFAVAQGADVPLFEVSRARRSVPLSFHDGRTLDRRR